MPKNTPTSGKVVVDTICPHCGKENKTTIYPVVNSALNPKIAKRIMDDTLYDEKCNNCGEVYYPDYSTMYVDEENDCVVCYSADDEGEALFVEGVEFSAATRDQSEEMRTIRIVRNRNSFREKARIFAMGLDDRIVELFKVWGLEYLRESGIKEEVSYALCWILDDGSLEISYFTKKSEDGYMLTIPSEQYQEAEEDLLDCLCEIEEECDYYIDFDWAMQFIIDNDL